jgi:hypothetical protein
LSYDSDFAKFGFFCENGNYYRHKYTQKQKRENDYDLFSHLFSIKLHFEQQPFITKITD